MEQKIDKASQICRQVNEHTTNLMGSLTQTLSTTATVQQDLKSISMRLDLVNAVKLPEMHKNLKKNQEEFLSTMQQFR